MNRYLPALAGFALTFMAATMLLGLALGDVSDPTDRQTQQWATVHRLSGVAAALVVVLVDSIVVTYFIGTSRWCKEVVETYRLDRSFLVRMNRLKRRTFPVATISMLVVVGVVALGGAADPGASLRLKPLGGLLEWSQLHLIGALVGWALVGAGFLIAWNNVNDNVRLIGEVMESVKQVRVARGLETEVSASPAG